MSQSRMSGRVFCVALIATLGAGLAGASGTEGLPAADWLIATVDATREVGYNVSVAVDAETGHTYISYYEGNDGDLWLARTGAPVGNCGPGNTWECQVLDSTGVVGKYSSIAVGGDGPVASLYISYHDVSNGSLKVIDGGVTRATGALTYSRVVVESGNPPSFYTGTETSIILDGNGTPHIGYQIDFGAVQAVKYAVQVAPGSGVCGATAGHGWQCEAIHVAADIGDFIAIDVNLGGNPSMAFHTSYSTHTFPMFATRTGPGGTCNNSDQWNCFEVRNGGQFTGDYLAFVMAEGLPHLAYRNEHTDSLELATWVGSPNGNCGPYNDSWQCEWIDDIGPGTSPAGIAMETDSDGNPIIVYQDLESGYEDLKIARPQPPFVGGNCGPWSTGLLEYTWLCETLEEGNLSHAEAYGGLSIAVNANGEAAVAYRELFGLPPLDGRLKIAMEPISIFLDGFESGDTTRWSAVVP